MDGSVARPSAGRPRSLHVEIPMAPGRESPESLLPLKPAWFHILLSLGDGALHGSAIRTEVEERTEGRVRLWPVTLYGSIRELEEEALIREADPSGAGEEDARRKYYALTGRGRAALAAEADRLQSLVDAARASRALEGA